MATVAMAHSKQDDFPPPASSGSAGRRRILVIIDAEGEELVRQLRRQFPQASIHFVDEGPNGSGATTRLLPEFVSQLGACVRQPPMAQITPLLTPRQASILKLITMGCSNKEIARALSISPFTVRNHVSLLLRVLDVTTRGEAAKIAGQKVVNEGP
ncbi:response regulator transcription factor [Labrys okinawensis]|uniref:response regulator transcription factor n=1 Tax=Labrys okinawensis TaxID=346911 RepID=UPI0039BD47F7